MGHIPPSALAELDQIRAGADASLNNVVQLVRDHIAHHAGDASCAFARAAFIARVDRQSPELFAAALVRLAQTATNP